MSAVRTLFISHDGGLAGAQRVLLSTVRGLDPTLIRPYLVVPHYGELQQLAVASGIEVSRRTLQPWAPCVESLNNKGLVRHLAQVASGLRERVWGLTGIIERAKIDLVYTNTAIVLEGAIAARRTGRPHIWHIHEPIHDNPEIFPLLPRSVYLAVINRLSSQIVMPSQSLLCSYPTLKPRTTVVYNGITLPPTVDRIACRQQLRERLKLPEHTFLIGTVGAIQPRKDYRTLISAARRLHVRLPDIRFIIVGNGAPEFIDQIDTYITELGLTEIIKRIPKWEGEIADFFAGVEIATISSVQESFGLTAAEALGVGTPVVSTRCGGPVEVLGRGYEDFLVDVGDADGLAAVIEKLYRDQPLRNRLGSNGRTRVIQKFTHDTYLNGIYDVILTVINNTNKYRPLAAGEVR